MLLNIHWNFRQTAISHNSICNNVSGTSPVGRLVRQVGKSAGGQAGSDKTLVDLNHLTWLPPWKIRLSSVAVKASRWTLLNIHTWIWSTDYLKLFLQIVSYCFHMPAVCWQIFTHQSCCFSKSCYQWSVFCTRTVSPFLSPSKQKWIYWCVMSWSTSIQASYAWTIELHKDNKKQSFYIKWHPLQTLTWPWTKVLNQALAMKLSKTMVKRR